MTEAELLMEVMRLAEENNILAHHCGDSRRCSGNNGMPDLLLVGKHHTMYVELKAWNKLSPSQRLWRDRLTATGQEYAVWTPYELKTGEVQETLAWL